MQVWADGVRSCWAGFCKPESRRDKWICNFFKLKELLSNISLVIKISCAVCVRERGKERAREKGREWILSITLRSRSTPFSTISVGLLRPNLPHLKSYHLRKPECKSSKYNKTLQVATGQLRSPFSSCSSFLSMRKGDRECLIQDVSLAWDSLVRDLQACLRCILCYMQCSGNQRGVVLMALKWPFSLAWAWSSMEVTLMDLLCLL